MPIILGIVVFIRLLNYYFQESKEDIKPNYVCNGNIKNVSLITNAYRTLDIDFKESIHSQLLLNAYCKQLQFAEEDKMLGIKSTRNIKDIEAAKEYLLDYLVYAGNLN